MYEGEFFNGLKEGPGKYQWSDGTIYSGQWKSDQMDG